MTQCYRMQRKFRPVKFQYGSDLSGRLCLYRKKIHLSVTLAGQAVGVKEVDGGIWLVSFMDYDLGYIDLEEKTLQPLANPFGPKVLPMSQERTVTYVSGPDNHFIGAAGGI